MFNNLIKKIFIIIISSDLLILLLNENFILFFSYILMLNVFILFLIKFRNKTINNFELNNLNFNEVIKNFVKIRYQLLLWMKQLLYKILVLFNFCILKFNFILNTKLNFKIKNNRILFENNIKIQIMNRLENLINIKEELMLGSALNDKGLKTYNYYNNNNLIKKFNKIVINDNINNN